MYEWWIMLVIPIRNSSTGNRLLYYSTGTLVTVLLLQGGRTVPVPSGVTAIGQYCHRLAQALVIRRLHHLRQLYLELASAIFTTCGYCKFPRLSDHTTTITTHSGTITSWYSTTLSCMYYVKNTLLSLHDTVIVSESRSLHWQDRTPTRRKDASVRYTEGGAGTLPPMPPRKPQKAPGKSDLCCHSRSTTTTMEIATDARRVSTIVYSSSL